MSRYIDADALIADMRERYCKPCQQRKEDYNGVRCRACWVDDAMDEVDGFGDDGIDIVRCKECKWASPNNEGDYDCKCHIPIFRVDAEGYCYLADRKESD